MSFTNQTVKVTYVGNGSTTSFAIAHELVEDPTSTVEVWLRDENVTPATEVLKTFTTDYTFTPNDTAPTNVVMNTAPATGEKLIIKRNISETQETDYLNSAEFQAEDHESALDKLTGIVQEHTEELSRTPKMLNTSPTSSITMEEPEDDKVLQWSSGKLVNTALTTTDATLATQVQAEAGTENTTYMSPLRVKQFYDMNLQTHTTGAVSVDTDTDVLRDAGADAHTITLPEVSDFVRNRLVITKTGVNNNVLTIAPDATDVINGALIVSPTLEAFGDTMVLIPNGASSWLVESQYNQYSRIQSITTTDAIDESAKIVKIDSSSGAFTVTLPEQVQYYGQKLIVKKTTSDLNVITLDGSGSETINGSANTTLNTEGETLTLYADPLTNDWIIESRDIPQTVNSFTPTGLWTTNVAYSGTWHREGEFAVIQYLVETSDTPGQSGGFYFNMPSGMTVDESKLLPTTVNNHLIVGHGSLIEAAAEYACQGRYDTDNSNQVAVWMLSAGGTFVQYSQASNTTPGTFAGEDDDIQLIVKLPITGWDT